jgi:CheY-like chemotaxis protein
VLAEADFELDKLIESVIQAAAESCRDKDVEVACYYPPALQAAVLGDEGRLRQVLLNLLGNAVKFTEHGDLTFRTTPAARTPDGRAQVTFAVADTGIGIAEGDLPLLFEPFAQIDASANRQFGGTGLGLPITRQLIGLMGGQLDVRSQPGSGSEFSFTIPLTSRPGSPVRRPWAGSLSGQRLLIVHHHPASRQLLSEHADAWGLEAAAVPDARSALDCLRSAAEHHQPYAMAIIDQQIPDVNGVHLTRLIMADPAIAATKIVMLTSGSYRDEEAAIIAGAAAGLPKPVCPSQIYNCLLNLLDTATDTDADADTDANANTAKAGQNFDSPVPGHIKADWGPILLAEDNEINQMVAADNLSMLGYRVDIARNGIEAVRLATTNSYLAVLMDCQMPTMDGFTATAQLRRQELPDQHLPIIAMTAGALAEDKQRCLDAGMDDYLAKPLDPNQLRAALTRWTSQLPGPRPPAT